MEPTTTIGENLVDETPEIGIQEAPNKELMLRLDKLYIEFVREKAEAGEYEIQDESLRGFLTWLNKKLGNPKGL